MRKSRFTEEQIIKVLKEHADRAQAWRSQASHRHPGADGDRTRASTGSHQLSSQHAPARGKTGTGSPYERGQVGEQVRCNLLTIRHSGTSAGAAN